KGDQSGRRRGAPRRTESFRRMSAGGGAPGRRTAVGAGRIGDHPGPRGAARREETHGGLGLGSRSQGRAGSALRVRPLPRLHAVTDADVLALPDLGVRAAAIAAAGPAVALHARERGAGGAALAQAAARLRALARPAEAAVLVNGRPDIAAAIAAHGVQLAS